MLNFDCTNVSKDVIGETHGLDLHAAFNDYQENTDIGFIVSIKF